MVGGIVKRYRKVTGVKTLSGFMLSRKMERGNAPETTTFQLFFRKMGTQKRAAHPSMVTGSSSSSSSSSDSGDETVIGRRGHS